MRFLPFLLAILSPVALAQDRAPAKVLTPGELPAKQNFHLYILFGQSNMAGRGKVDAESQPNDARLLVFNRDGRWALAADPLHWDKPVAGVGLGLAFAKAMAGAQPGVTIGLIPCAVGGTPLSRWQKGGDLYEAAVARAKAAATSGTLKGALWHQGESDAGNAKTASTYRERFEQMVKDLRTDLGIKDLPVVAGELGEFHVQRVGANSQAINDALHEAAKAVPRVACVDAKGLKHGGDNLHFDAASLRDFGRRYAKAMRSLDTTSGK
jgi:hypothetical protein